ncbi:MAG: hypothetical protein FWG92_06355 [Leptospirales bacterium]|nr:hypothetical protein [Leptospirales bacterium]
MPDTSWYNSSGIVKNLTLEGVNIVITNGSSIGGVAGVNRGTVSSCFLTGIVEGGYYVGGFLEKTMA